MYLRSITFALFLHVAISALGSADPTLSASPNPIVVPDGQTQATTTLTWNTEGPMGFIWVSVDESDDELLSDEGIAEGTLKVTAEVGKHYTFKLYTRDKEKLLASVNVAVTTKIAEPSPSLPPIAPPKNNVYPAYIYAISSDGTLEWFRHDRVENDKFEWQGPRNVGTGWNKYKFVFPGGSNIIYAITTDGVLQWYRHTGYQTGLDSWEGPNNVGRGWVNLKQVFSGSDGIIYAINADDKLLWFRHNGTLSGAGLDITGAWTGPKEVGRGWANLKAVFSMGGGIIYAVTREGKLEWFKHNGYLDGRGLESPGAWRDRIELGPWSGSFKQLFSSGNGNIYEVDTDGNLIWSMHLSFTVGFSKPFIPPIAFGVSNSDWRGGLPVGEGWGNFIQVFALLPSTDKSNSVLPVKAPSVGGNPTPRHTPNDRPNR